MLTLYFKKRGLHKKIIIFGGHRYQKGLKPLVKRSLDYEQLSRYKCNT